MFVDCPKSCFPALLTLAVASCGSGSSAPPPPDFDPPLVEFSTSEETVLSGATRNFGVQGTADRISATPDVSCTGNVQVASAVRGFDLVIPEVSVLSQSVCTATLTDSIGRTRSDSLTLTILPRTDIGQVVGIFDPALELAVGNTGPAGTKFYGSQVLGISEIPGAGGEYRIRAIAGDSVFPLDYYRDDIFTYEGSFDEIDLLQSPSLVSHGLKGMSYSVVNTAGNRITWHALDDATRNFSFREEIDVTRPCYLRETDRLFGRDLLVGHVGAGLSVYDLAADPDSAVKESFTTTLIQNIGAGRSLCHILRAHLPRSISDPYPGYSPIAPFNPYYAFPVWALDFDTLELVYFGDINSDNVLEEMGVIPIETNATGDLEIVQVITRGIFSAGTRYMLVLLSDGQHDGEHRVIQIGSEDGPGDQKILHAWSEGVPVAMVQENFGGSLEGAAFRSDLVVVLGTTERSFFFDNLLPWDAETDHPVYGEPVEFDVGIGAGSAVAARRPEGPADDQGIARAGVLVSYPATGEVIYISLADIQ